jgi:FkbM family methyltransferase
MNLLTALRVQADHIAAFWRLRQHFKNPWLVALLRLGWIKLPYFPYRLQQGENSYRMLARPDRSSTSDFFVLREVLVEETYRDVLPLLPQRGLRMVDIGANLGSFTIWLSHRAKVEEAFCFEPEPGSFRLLQFNLANNGCGFARALPQAAGGRARTAQILLKDGSPGGTNIYSSSGGERPEGTAVEVVAFGDWLKRTPGSFDLLKMDCEGSEWEIVRLTSPSDFSRFHALIAEVHMDPEGLLPVEQFGSLVEALGFRTVRWDRKAAGLYVGVRDPQANRL